MGILGASTSGLGSSLVRMVLMRNLSEGRLDLSAQPEILREEQRHFYLDWHCSLILNHQFIWSPSSLPSRLSFTPNLGESERFSRP